MAERQRVRQEKILLVERPGRSSKFQFQPKLGLGTCDKNQLATTDTQARAGSLRFPDISGRAVGRSQWSLQLRSPRLWLRDCFRATILFRFAGNTTYACQFYSTQLARSRPVGAARTRFQDSRPAASRVLSQFASCSYACADSLVGARTWMSF